MPGEWMDQPTPVRSGEELDSSALELYLCTQVPDLDGPISISQFPAGHSNLTYLVRAGEREFVLRRPPVGARIRSAHDMAREYNILSRLVRAYPKVPRPILLCTDESVLGAQFYIVERLNGVILRTSPPDGLELPPTLMHTLSKRLVDELAEIHAVDYAAVGLSDLGHPLGYVQRQIEGWTRRYRNARTDDIPAIDRVATWLADHMPVEAGAALIHNDYKYDNLVLDPGDLSRIIGVLDWEMATIGDPLMDLGTTLGYWVEAGDPAEMRLLAMVPTTLPGNLTRRQLAQRYTEQSGRDISNILFYYVYALFKIAVIAQQIYARYQAGLTKDERFATFIFAVHMLSGAAELAIEKGRIDDLGNG